MPGRSSRSARPLSKPQARRLHFHGLSWVCRLRNDPERPGPERRPLLTGTDCPCLRLLRVPGILAVEVCASALLRGGTPVSQRERQRIWSRLPSTVSAVRRKDEDSFQRLVKAKTNKTRTRSQRIRLCPARSSLRGASRFKIPGNCERSALVPGFPMNLECCPSGEAAQSLGQPGAAASPTATGPLHRSTACRTPAQLCASVAYRF